MPTTRTADPELVARGTDLLTHNIRMNEGWVVEAHADLERAQRALAQHEAHLEELRAALAEAESVQYPIVDPVLAAAADGQVADWEAELFDDGTVG